MTLNSLMAGSLALAASILVTNVGLAQEGADKKEEIKPVAVGEKAPDFELETFDGKTVKLSDRFGKDGKPVVLLFSRANW